MNTGLIYTQFGKKYHCLKKKLLKHFNTKSSEECIQQEELEDYNAKLADLELDNPRNILNVTKNHIFL